LDEQNRVNAAIPKVMVMEDMSKPRRTFMLEKGIYDKPLREVHSGDPRQARVHRDRTSHQPARSRALAGGAGESAPARVTVNRLWQQFFGIGLVKTPEDFGVQGERPVNPELLDWLAGEFIHSGWNVKELCRSS